MPQVPAICLTPNCNTLFPSGVELQNARNISFHNCTSGPCPKCGGDGKIPDGSYDAFENKLFAFLFQENDLNLFRKITETVQRDLNRNISPKNIKKKLNKQFPKHKNTWSLIPESKLDAYAVIQIILAVISTAIAIGSCTKSNKETIINQTYNNIYIENNRKTLPRIPSDSRIERKSKPDNSLNI
ncbi:MAG: hypothetical protein ACD_48C00622G0004 [uncultured bacterium]|nr:MAG: hypothetical protein ACD_48C00622G0004 [uncultured bacterium]